MELNYKPTKNFEGYIKLRMPRYKERLEMIKSLNFKPAQADGGIEVEQNQNNGIDAAIVMNEMVEKHVLEVSLKHIESGKVIDSLIILEMYKEGVELINEVAGALINGVALGNA